MERVLILAPDRDFHALAIQALIRERGSDADILDTGKFPSDMRLVNRAGSFNAVELDGHALSSYRSIWWRRPNPPVLPDEVKSAGEEARFAHRECREALWGAIHASGVPIFNRPEMESLANYKPYQLHVARAVGFLIPETLVTNDREAVVRFRERHGAVVYKGLSATTLRMTETRLLQESDLEDLWRLRYAPAIFQSYIELGREFRATVIQERVFLAEITVTSPKARVDWRLDPGYKIYPAQIDEDTVTKLVRLTEALNLDSGSVDLRQSPTGDLYFLEINPSGQFMFLDIFGGMNVGDAFCDMLLRGRPSRLTAPPEDNKALSICPASLSQSIL